MPKFALIVLCGLALAAAACSRNHSAPQQPPQGPPGEPGAALRLPVAVQPVSYRIDIAPDAAKLTFTGSETIQVQARRQVRTIVLNALNLSIASARLDAIPVRKVTLDEDRQTATFDFGRPIAAGVHRLSITYSGKIDDSSAGLFHLDFTTPRGKQRVLVTQFEPADARRFAPCWDDPAVKASFQLSVVAPEDQMAVSNMPVAHVHWLGRGLRRTEFEPTPKMSSYLLFLGVGDFQRISRKVDGVDVGVVVPRGELEKARFALGEAARFLHYYDQYFGIRYPLPKLDLVAGPGSGGFGAMENWGAIFFFERDLLVDPRLSTEQDRQDVSIDVAHEMAHQWFGDLVTMNWWNDLWLNESFATWMEAKAVDHLHPDWHIQMSESAGRERALELDATSATHPIVQPVETIDQMNEIGDSITYSKGAAVLRMLEAYVGPEAWRAGVRAYLKAHAYGNSTRADLWNAVEAASGKPIAGMAADFTEQDGVPLIGVQQIPGLATGSGVFLTEQRFSADAASIGPRHWRIPVVARPLNGPEVQALVHGGPLVTALTSASSGPLVVNPDEVGYFRTFYAASAFDPLAQQFSRLDPFDQLSMLQDNWALAQAAGFAPPDNLMTLLSHLPPDANPLVWSNAADIIADIYYLHAPADRAAFAAFGQHILDPVLARLGWTPRPGESAAAAVARGALIRALADLGDPGVIAEANRRFQAFLSSPASLPAAIRRPVLDVAGLTGGAQAFQALQKLAEASTDPQATRQYLTALARTQDPALAQRALDLALSPKVEPSAGMDMIRVASHRLPDLVWRFATAHKGAIDARSDSAQKLFFIPDLLDNAADAALADQLHAYALKAFPPGGRAEAHKAEVRVRQRAYVRARRLPALDQWLKANAATS